MANNLLTISNILNLICQQHTGIETYHYGYESDVYRNVDNNFNQGNILGNKFPYVLLEKLQTETIVSNAGIKSTANCRLNFFALQHYNNDGSANTDQTIEQEQDLRTICLDVLSAMTTAFKSLDLGVLQSRFTIESQEQQTPQRLIQIVATFQLFFVEACSSFVFNPATVALPYSYPPSSTVDFEKLTTP